MNQYELYKLIIDIYIYIYLYIYIYIYNIIDEMNYIYYVKFTLCCIQHQYTIYDIQYSIEKYVFSKYRYV